MSVIEWQFSDKSVDVDYVLRIGQDLGFDFPKDYVDCVAINNGANVEPELFDVNHKEKVFGTLLSFNDDNDEFIVSIYKSYRKTLPKEVVPFAFDSAGNLICFDYKDDVKNPLVVFWEHENAGEKEIIMRDEGLTEEQVEERARENVFYVAESFTEFLNKLHE